MKYIIKHEKNSPPVTGYLKKMFQGKPNALNSYYYSRLALSELLNIDFDPDRLQITNHHFMTNFPEQIVSISHTKDIGAAVIASRSKYLSIGIDIERKDRLVKENSKKFFTDTHDEGEYSLLELWVAKEAIFKAYFPLYKGTKTLVLSDFWIRGYEFGHKENYKQVLGIVSMEENKDLIIALASIKLQHIAPTWL